MANSERGAWWRTDRTLHDGVHLAVQPIKDHDDKVFVNVTSAEGYQLFTGTMLLLDALVEIPYQLDKARIMDAELRAKREERGEDD